jgi:hypothetical protein
MDCQGQFYSSSQEWEGTKDVRGCLKCGLPKPILQGHAARIEKDTYMTVYDIVIGCLNDGLRRPILQGHAVKSGKDT